MTQPLTLEERDEVENLVAECESPDRLRACLAELLRLRAFTSFCRRNHNRLPNAVQRLLDGSVPKLSQSQQWARVVGASNDEDDCRRDGAPRLL